MEKQKQERLENSKNMSLEEVFDIVEQNNSSNGFRSVIRGIGDMLDNILAAPDDPKFRHIRLENEAIQGKRPGPRMCVCVCVISSNQCVPVDRKCREI